MMETPRWVFQRSATCAALYQTVRDGALHALADRLLVHVSRRRVQQAVACGDGVADDLFTLGGIGDLKDPKAFLGHFYAVAECQEFHDMFLLLDLISVF